MEEFITMMCNDTHPIAVLQQMCLVENMNVNTLRSFVYYCATSGIAVPRHRAEQIIYRFHRDHMHNGLTQNPMINN